MNTETNKQQQESAKIRNIADETAEKLRDLSGDLQDRYGDLFDQASGWLEENRTVVMAGAMVAVGVISFFIGRSSVRSDQPEI